MSSYLIYGFMFFPSFLGGLVIYFISFFIVFHGDEWFVVWLGLELNMLGFLLLVIDRKSNFSIEVLFKYYFIQVVSSGVLLIGLVLGLDEWVFSFILGFKMGVGPFYYWFVSMVDKMSWGSGIMLMTFQKVIPFYLIGMCGGNEVMVFGVMSVLIGVIGSFGVVSLKSLFGFSSVHHTGWMVVIQLYDFYKGWMYLFFYFIMMVVSLLWIMSYNIVYLTEGLVWGSAFIILVLSLGGVPPMFGFFLKWFGLIWVLGVNLIIGLLFLVTSVIMLYVYLRMVLLDMSKWGDKLVWLMSGSIYFSLVEMFHIGGGFIIFFFCMVY